MKNFPPPISTLISSCRLTKLLAAILFVTTGAGLASAQTTGFKQSGSGPFDYNAADNWVDGKINGFWDFSLTLKSAQTITFSSNATLSTGLVFDSSGSTNVTFRAIGGPFTLTLGGDLTVRRSGDNVVSFGSATAGENLLVDLGGAVRKVTVPGIGNGGNSGNTIAFLNPVSNGGITASGGGTGGGKVLLNGNSNSLSSLEIQGAEVSFGGDPSGNSESIVSGELVADAGPATISLTGRTAGHALLQANAFRRNPGATILFRGTDLGLNPLTSASANSSNIAFIKAPALAGGPGITGILTGAFGDTAAKGTGFGETGGLVTYDAINGVRLLGAGEYSESITTGGKQPENVRFSNSSGTPITSTLSSPITNINSLSISVKGTGGNQGVTISSEGNAVLKIISGVIYADQNVTGESGPKTSDAMVISVPALDLNGQEGIILANTRMNPGGTVQSNGGLEITSAITNAKGLTIADGLAGYTGGFVVFSGTSANTYSGTTTVNGAILRLNKRISASSGNKDGTFHSGENPNPEDTGEDALNVAAIPGDLVLNLGAIYDSGNQIANNANLIIHSGTFFLNGSNNSGSASNETIKSLTMTGGGVSSGSGNGNTFNVNGNLDLSGGSISLPPSAKLNVGGASSFSGGTLSLGSSSNEDYNARICLRGNVTITNTPSGAYAPITLASGFTTLMTGGQLELSGNLTFIGNESNPDTVTISGKPGEGSPGVFALDGSHSFNIGEGAAVVDLAISIPLIDGASEGGLTKTGAGTLELQGANTYTGRTVVTAGNFVFNGSGVSPINVSGGVLTGSGTISRSVDIGNGGTMSPGCPLGTMGTGDLNLAGAKAKLCFDISGSGPNEYDQIHVTGSVKFVGGGQIELLLPAFVPKESDVFFVILNDGADPIKGILTGLPQGATFRSGDHTWQVSYTGDAGSNSFIKAGGNDLALRVVPEPAKTAPQTPAK